jgi:outer membrane murein-binding lipoprotein Lpp
MKRTFLTVCILLSALLLGGCHEDIERRINALKEDVSTIEQRLNTLNEGIRNLSSLVEALEQNEHITSIKPWTIGTWSGYYVTFTSGTVLTLRNGIDGVSPIVGVNYNEAYNAYYWTIQMGPSGTVNWMTNSTGQRVRATSIVPELKIEDGVWWYSFDGSSWIKAGWGPAQGESGSSVFSSIDTSDPYYVTFTLSNRTSFKIPTQKAFDELNAQCNALNKSIDNYSKLVNEIPSSIFVKSVSNFEEEGTSGIHITLEDGQVLTIRNGYDNRDSVLLSAKKYTDGKSYWVYRSHSDQEYQWLRYQGKMICVTYEDITPHIGITDSLGQLYFTVAIGEGAAEMMRDAKGNAVRATGTLVEDLFKAADFSDSHQVVLTLSDGTQITLPRTREHVPSVTTSLRNDYVESATSYARQIVLYLTDTLATQDALPDFETYCDSADIHIEALCLDDGFIEELRLLSFESKKVTGGYEYSMSIDVRFSTGSAIQWNTAYKSRIAIFVSWLDKSIMKVVQFRRIVYPTSLSLPATAEVVVGKTVTLSASWTPATATETSITWKTSDASVATVTSKGVVTGVKVGTCTITAEMRHLTASCTVTVKPAAP